MFTHSSTAYGAKILIELVRDIIYFPLWWYYGGLKQVILTLKNFLIDRERSLALFVWIKNIHRPMYGQYDWQGRLISFFMRLIQIIVRAIIMLFWLAVAIAALGLWLILPALIIYEIILQLV